MTAVVDEGFQSFSAAQANAAPNGLLALGRAYRAWALSHPVVYRLMFGTPQMDVDCRPTLDVSHQGISPLMAAVAGSLEGRLAAGATVPTALSIWGQVHGIFSLELSGYQLPSGTWTDAFEAALAGISRAYLEG